MTDAANTPRTALELLADIEENVKGLAAINDELYRRLREAEAAAAAPTPAEIADDVLMTLDDAFAEDAPEWAYALAERMRAALTAARPETPASAEQPGLREALAAYAGALEGIILSLPGKPLINGLPMSNGEGIVYLRSRFGVKDAVIDQAALAAKITHDDPSLAASPSPEPEGK